MSLIRQLLLQVESDSGQLSVAGREPKEVMYHLALMHEAGLIDATVLNDGDGLPYRAVVRRLTWQGHDFIDSIRNDTVWNGVVKHVLKPGVAWTFDVVKEYLKFQALQSLGIKPS